MYHVAAAEGGAFAVRAPGFADGMSRRTHSPEAAVSAAMIAIAPP